MGLEYLGHGPDLAYAHDFAVISRDLTRNLVRTLPDVLTEIDASFNELLSKVEGEDWAQVDMLDHLANTAHRAAAAMFYGRPLCRDATYLKLVRIWTICFGVGSAFHRMLFPKVLQPVLGHLLAMLMYPVQWLVARKTMPVIRQRLRHLQQSRISEKPVSNDEKPRDMLQWIIDDAAQKRDIATLTPWDLAGKALLVEFLGRSPASSTLCPSTNTA